jgi:hypothetical protein
MKQEEIAYRDFDDLYYELANRGYVAKPTVFNQGEKMLLEMQFIEFLRNHKGLPQQPLPPDEQPGFVKKAPNQPRAKSEYDQQREAYQKAYCQMITKSNWIAFVRQQKRDIEIYKEEQEKENQSWEIEQPEPPTAGTKTNKRKVKQKLI